MGEAMKLRNDRVFVFCLLIVAIALGAWFFLSSWKEESSGSRGSRTAARAVSVPGEKPKKNRLLEVGEDEENEEEKPVSLIRVVSDLDSSPIGGASLVFVRAHLSEPDLAMTNDRGEAGLYFEGPVSLTIRAPGFCGIQGQYEVSPREQEFRLLPSGSLAIRILDVNGQPVSGVGIELVCPLDEPIRIACELAGELIGWAAVSNAAGICAWEGLPASPGYRWSLLSTHILTMVPSHEDRGISMEKGLIRRGVDPPPGLSGVFEIEPGESKQIHLEVTASGKVVGFVRERFGRSVKRPLVKVFHESRHDEEGGKAGLIRYKMEGHTRADEDGWFSISDLRPGKKKLRALIEEEGQQFSFVELDFELGAGEERDLGALHPMEGSTLKGVVVLQDMDGRDLRAEDIFGAEEELQVVLGITTRPQRSQDPRVSEKLAVDLGVPFSLCGLPPGRCYLRGGLPGEWPLAKDPGIKFEKGIGASVELPSLDEVVLPFVFSSGQVETTITFAIPSGEDAFPCQVYLRNTKTGHFVEKMVIPYPQGLQSVLVGEVHVGLPTGEYDVLIHSGMDADEGVGPSYFSSDTIDLSNLEGGVLAFSLQPASLVRGVIRDSSGHVRPGVVVPFTFGPWTKGTEDGRRCWVYSARADNEGRFAFRGVVPHARLTSLMLESAVEVGAPGAETYVEVVAKY